MSAAAAGFITVFSFILPFLSLIYSEFHFMLQQKNEMTLLYSSNLDGLNNDFNKRLFS